MEMAESSPTKYSRFFFRKMVNSLPRKSFFGLVKIQSICRRQEMNMTENLKCVFGRENIVGKGENADYQHFSFSYIVFKMVLLPGVKTRGCCGET